MKALLSWVLLVSFAATTLYANECLDLVKCVESISKLTGKKYLYTANDLKGGVQTTLNTQITAENADTLFTYILDLNGLTRIPVAESDTYMIVPSRDVRYQLLTSVNVDSKNGPKLANTADYYLMTYQFKYYSQNQMRAATNSLRPFMSRYARVVELKLPGILIVQEQASKFSKLYELIKAFDRELSKDELKTYKDEEKERLEDIKNEKREKGKFQEKSQDKHEEKN